MPSHLPSVPQQPNREILPLAQARKRLAEAQSFTDFTAIRDQAEMVRSCAKTARLGLEILNDAAEIKIRAACTSALTVLIQGHSMAECEHVTADDISRLLSGIPYDKVHCPEIAIAARRHALQTGHFFRRSDGL